MLKISIIIPCYNVEKYIDKCMNSILNQTIGIENLEIILVDDKSTDNTVERLKQYEVAYPEQIMLILCEKNGRQGTARNIGMSYATGEYISFVDSDDWIRKDMYEILTTLIEETNADIVQFDFKPGEEGELDIPLETVEYNCYDFSDEDQKRGYLLSSEIYNESCTRKIYKRELVLNSGVAYAEGVSYEEPLFTYPLKFYVNKVCRLYVPLYYYRYNGGGTSAEYLEKVSTILEHLDVQQRVYCFMKESTPYYEKYKYEIDLYFLHTFYVEAFYFLKYRGIVLPAKIFLYMCNEVRSQLPDYKNNPYLNDPSLEDEKKLVGLIKELEDADLGRIDLRLKEVADQL